MPGHIDLKLIQSIKSINMPTHFMPDKTRIVMYGPSLTATSGISSVVNNWIGAGYKEKVELRYISTLTEYIPGNYLQKFIDALSAYYQTFFIRSKTTDIVHIHVSSGMSFYRKLLIFIIVKIKGLPVIVHLHGSMFEEFYRRGSWLRKSLIRIFFSKADMSLVLSASWKSFLETITRKGNIRILYNGASSNIFSGRRSADSSSIVISFMGRLGQRKGTYDLLDAFSRLVSEVPEARLVLGGDGEVEKVRRIVNERNLNDRVEVPGWVQGECKIAVFTGSDIYVLPSYNEGLPGSIMEAMAAGLPVISTPIGGIPEAVIEGHNGFLVNPGDVDALYKSMLCLCKDRDLRKKMGNESLKLIETKFDVSYIVDKLVEYYSETASVSREASLSGE